MNMEEEWKTIEGHEAYLISSFGRCVSKDRYIIMKNGTIYHKKSKMKKPHDNGNGYFAYLINGKHRYIHRLVALAFIPNPLNKEEVDHIDGNKANNKVSNLRWVTRSENLLNPVTHSQMSEAQDRKEVVILDADGNYVTEVEGIAVMCRLLGFTTGGIKRCLRNSEKSKSINGFQYVYKEDYNPTNDYSLCLSHNMGYDYVFNERIVVVYSHGSLFDVFPSTNYAESFFNVPRKYIYDICTKHIPICEKHKRKLPDKSEMYFYKDLDGKMKEEVRRYYRNKYPIPKII